MAHVTRCGGAEGITRWERPALEEIRMDAEIGAYQPDQEPPIVKREMLRPRAENRYSSRERPEVQLHK